MKVRKAKTAIIAPTQAPEVQRVAAHFAAALSATAHRPLSLAVVPVDDFQVPALSLALIAVSCDQEAGASCSGGPMRRELPSPGC